MAGELAHRVGFAFNGKTSVWMTILLVPLGRIEMSRFFGAALSLLLMMAFAGFLGCEGDQGLEGPSGPQGPGGEDGRDASTDPPGDMVFGLSVTSNSEFDHNGNTRLTLTFNQSATPSESVVVCYNLDRPPTIDGSDKGVSDWGSEFDVTGSRVELTNLRGESNRIFEAKVRAGYDDNFVYFLVSWVESSQLTPNGDWTPDRWIYQWHYELEGDSIVDSTFGWGQVDSDEDRLYLFWDISGVSGWDQNGSSLLYHGDDSLLYVDEEGALVDVWHWKAGRTGLKEFFDDEYIDGPAGVCGDQGNPAFALNEANGLPKWMHRLGPDHDGQPPLHLYDTDPFDGSAGWDDNAKIPGYVSLVPTGGRADIICSNSKLSWSAAQNQWTLEFKRARNTGHGDDVKF